MTDKKVWDYPKYLSLKAIAHSAVMRYKRLSILRYIMEPCKTADAIYQPGGKAGEYAKYACSIYVGCYGGCDYCYRNEQPLARAIGGSIVRLKKCFSSEEDAVNTFFRELFGGNRNKPCPELLKHGIFFTFTSDPGLPETFPLVAAIIAELVKLHVPVQFLTKFTGWMDTEIWQDLQSIPELKQYLAIGFTLTGCDDHEPGTSPNSDRIAALQTIHESGFKTFASIEPIIDFESSFTMMMQSSGDVDLYRVGLLSHRKYDRTELMSFANELAAIPEKPYIYLKDSFIEQLRRTRESFGDYFVNVDFTPFDAR